MKCLLSMLDFGSTPDVTKINSMHIFKLKNSGIREEKCQQQTRIAEEVSSCGYL